MRIAIFTNNYLPNPFGVSMSIESFRQEFEKNGHTVYIFAPGAKGYVDQNPNVFRYPALDLKFKNINFPLAIPFSGRMDEILEKLEIDVIHAQHPNLLGWAAKKWAQKKNVPLVFTWHTLYDQYAHFAPLVPEKLAAWWAIRNARNYANAADQIIVPTESVKKIILEWGVTNEKIEAVPTGVNEDIFLGADGKGVRKEYGILDDEIALLLLSRITAEKNVEFVAKTVNKILQKNPKVKFILAGQGSELENIKKIFSAAGTQEQVIYLGIVSNSEKKNVYAAGDIFVYASKSETQGMIISEAMYVGLPVVAVSATGVKDAVIDQETGLLVGEDEQEFSEAILQLANNGELRQKFSENAQRIARENYTSQVCGEKMLRIYEEVIKRKK